MRGSSAPFILRRRTRVSAGSTGFSILGASMTAAGADLKQ